MNSIAKWLTDPDADDYEYIDTTEHNNKDYFNIKVIAGWS